jgi:hypothetical protein
LGDTFIKDLANYGVQVFMVNGKQTTASRATTRCLELATSAQHHLNIESYTSMLVDVQKRSSPESQLLGDALQIYGGDIIE